MPVLHHYLGLYASNNVFWYGKVTFIPYIKQFLFSIPI